MSDTTWREVAQWVTGGGLLAALTALGAIWSKRIEANKAKNDEKNQALTRLEERARELANAERQMRLDALAELQEVKRAIRLREQELETIIRLRDDEIEELKEEKDNVWRMARRYDAFMHDLRHKTNNTITILRGKAEHRVPEIPPLESFHPKKEKHDDDS